MATTTTTAVAPARFFDAHRADKPWGHEIVFAEGGAGYVGKLITVDAGHSLSLQFHHRKDETISIVSGRARFDHGPDATQLETVVMEPGQTVHVPAGVVHRITAVTDLVFAEASTADPGGARTSSASMTGTDARGPTPPDQTSSAAPQSPGRASARPGSARVGPALTVASRR